MATETQTEKAVTLTTDEISLISMALSRQVSYNDRQTTGKYKDDPELKAIFENRVKAVQAVIAKIGGIYTPVQRRADRNQA